MKAINHAKTEFGAEAIAPAEPIDARFIINSEKRVNWYLRKQANTTAEIARIKAQTAQRIAELEADAARLRHLYEPQVQEWGKAERVRRRRQNITLEQGTLAFRAHGSGLRVVDAAAAIEHARAAYPAVVSVETREKFDAAAYLAHAQERGELLPGVEAVPAGEAFTIRFPRAKGETAD